MTDSSYTDLLRAAFDGLSRGDPAQILALMAEDFAWEIPGSSNWFGRWNGKSVVRQKLFAPLFAQFDGAYTNTADRFIEQGDFVVVQCRGNVATKRGERYENTYCYVCRFEGEQLKELIEYMDTALADAALDPPSEQPEPVTR